MEGSTPAVYQKIHYRYGKHPPFYEWVRISPTKDTPTNDEPEKSGDLSKLWSKIQELEERIETLEEK